LARNYIHYAIGKATATAAAAVVYAATATATKNSNAHLEYVSRNDFS
jgi:hypothetical protein